MVTTTQTTKKLGAFESPRDFLLSVLHVGAGGVMDPRLYSLRINATAGSDEQSGASDPFGGFAVPKSLFDRDPLGAAIENDPIASRVFTVPMTTPQVPVVARVDKDHSTSVSGGLVLARSLETVTKTATRMKLEQIVLQATSLFGLTYSTEEIVTDSRLALALTLASGFRDELAANLINEVLNGTGVGEREGILNCPALLTITKEGGQSADTIVYDNLIKMRARCWGYQNAIWLANHDCTEQIFKAADANGNRAWESSGREDIADLLLGRPLVFTEFAQTLGDSGDIVLANFSQYLEGILQPLQSAESIHVRWVEHERAFKFWVRNDGRSWWRAALTPRNSTTTLSPFVTLAERA